MSSREQFEAWYLENWGHTEDHLETLFERSPDDQYGYYRLGVRMSHQAWQESTKAMEAKCAALAAESAGLKIAAIFLSDEAAAIYKRWNLTQQPDGDIIDMQTIHDLVCACHDTPATDEFLAEVRAQGVEMAACALDDVNQFNYANMLDDLAQKIRQEAAQ